MKNIKKFTEWGRGGSDKTISAEFNDISHKRGIVSMARNADPNSASSQFFIVHKDSIFLDNKYTRWYWSIVASARSRAPNTNEIYDRHHIIPRSLDGNDNEDNLVNVTLREHFVLHRLLCHMTEGRAKRSMYWALPHDEIASVHSS